MLVSLPQSDDRARRMLYNRHAPNIENVKWIFEHRAAQFASSLRAFVNIAYRYIREPMGRDTLRGHLRVHFVKSTHVLAVAFQHRIKHLWTHRVISKCPVEKPCVEFFCRFAISRSEFNPAERSGCIRRTLLHSCFSHFHVSLVMSISFQAAAAVP